MKARFTLPLLVTVLGMFLVVAALGTGSPAAADGETAALTVCALVPTVTGDYEYVGSNKCKKCHIKEYKSWEKTTMAQALETLKPGVDAEIKTKFGLDPNKDYTTDESCLACHTTGHGKPGGHAIPPAGDEKAAKAAENLAHVGCESCHGPASQYLGIFEDIFKSKRKYKVDELHAAGMNKIDESTCTTCHNEKSPTYDKDDPFKFDPNNREGMHELVELKQREN